MKTETKFARALRTGTMDGPCADVMPDLTADRKEVADRACVLPAGHDGDCNDGAVRWTLAESEACRGIVQTIHGELLADAPRAARVAVMEMIDEKAHGKAPTKPSRQQRRAALRVHRGGKAQEPEQAPRVEGADDAG